MVSDALRVIAIHLFQYFVAYGVTQDIVDLFEIIEVDINQQCVDVSLVQRVVENDLSKRRTVKRLFL